MAEPISSEAIREQIKESTIPVLLDFWAPWCAPCREISPVLSELMDAYQDKLKLIHIDIDTYPDMAKDYNVHMIPALLIQNNDAAPQKLKVSKDKAILKEQIDSFLDTLLETAE